VTQEHWDDVVASWRGTRREQALRAYSDAVNGRLLRRWLPSVRGGRVLKTDLFDEAVGQGLYPVLDSLGASVAGVDISPAVVEAARRNYPQLEASAGDVRSLPLDDASFDAIVSNSTLDHFDSVGEIETAVRELRRVLAPGGVLVVTLDNPSNPLVALRNALPPKLLRRLGLVSFDLGTTCNRRELAELLQRAGLEVTDLGALMHVPRLLAAAVAVASKGRGQRVLVACEQLSRLPTRYWTGQFVAARAVVPSE
jgi:SAM-dependent methyltransferase